MQPRKPNSLRPDKPDYHVLFRGTDSATPGRVLVSQRTFATETGNQINRPVNFAARRPRGRDIGKSVINNKGGTISDDACVR